MLAWGRARVRAPPAGQSGIFASARPHPISHMPATGAAARAPLLVDDDSVFEWMQLHVREITIAVLVVVIVVGGVFLYRSAAATQAAQAEQALVGPEESLEAGNVPLARSDLRTVMKRYANTAAAAQAAILLADSYYTQHKFAEGSRRCKEPRPRARRSHSCLRLSAWSAKAISRKGSRKTPPHTSQRPQR